jgi:PEP-CTERM motif
VRFPIRLALLLVLFLSGGKLAYADEIVSYSFGNYFQNQILNDGNVGTSFDLLALTGQAGSVSIAAGSPVVLPISFVQFTDGSSCSIGCQSVATQNGSAAFSATINGLTQTLTAPFLACLNMPFSNCGTPTDDTIQLFASAPVSFSLADGSTLTLSSLDMAQLTGGGSGAHSGYLQGNFAVTAPVPEPSTVLLLGVGLLGVFALSRR